MKNWREWNIGDTIRYTFNDFDGSGTFTGILTGKYESHSIVDVDGMKVWLDDDTAHMFHKIK